MSEVLSKVFEVAAKPTVEELAKVIAEIHAFLKTLPRNPVQVVLKVSEELHAGTALLGGKGQVMQLVHHLRPLLAQLNIIMPAPGILLAAINDLGVVEVAADAVEHVAHEVASVAHEAQTVIEEVVAPPAPPAEPSAPSEPAAPAEPPADPHPAQ